MYLSRTKPWVLWKKTFNILWNQKKKFDLLNTYTLSMITVHACTFCSRWLLHPTLSWLDSHRAILYIRYNKLLRRGIKLFHVIYAYKDLWTENGFLQSAKAVYVNKSCFLWECHRKLLSPLGRKKFRAVVLHLLVQNVTTSLQVVNNCTVIFFGIHMAGLSAFQCSLLKMFPYNLRINKLGQYSCC